jgi:hypothetical protein
MPPQRDFDIGDKVVVRKGGECPALIEGKAYTVTEVSGNRTLRIMGGGSWWWNFSRFEFEPDLTDDLRQAVAKMREAGYTVTCVVEKITVEKNEF